MESIIIAPTERTPEINFNFANGKFSIKGEAYPADASNFFGPLLTTIQNYLRTKPNREIILNVHLDYFNSSSAKALMNLFKILDESVMTGVRAVVHWHYNENDETMREFGEDFAEDLRSLRFEMVRIG